MLSLSSRRLGRNLKRQAALLGLGQAFMSSDCSRCRLEKLDMTSGWVDYYAL